MGNPKKQYNDFENLREYLDGDDPLIWGVKVLGAGQAGHNKRVANTPEWATNNTQVRAVLLRAFPRWNTNQTQYERALRWAFIIKHYFQLGEEASKVALELRYEEAKKSGETWDAANADSGRKAAEQEIEKLIKRVTDTVGRISRVAQGLRTNGKPRAGKMGRPRKVERV
jgi:hypothetical protein